MVSLPSLAPSSAPAGRPKTTVGRKRSAADQQNEAIAGLCKTYTAATSKLLYAFAAIHEQDSSGSGDKVSSVEAALASSSRSVLLEKMAATLSSGVEKIVRSSDVSVRTAVLKDLRVRFRPREDPTLATVGCQAELEPPAKHPRHASDEAVPPPQPPPQPPLQPPPPSEDEAVPSPASLSSVSSATTAPRDMYERLKAWEEKKQARLAKERQKAEDEEKQRIEKARAARVSSSTLYSHVESKIKRERVAVDDARVAVAETAAQEAIVAREHAERAAEHDRRQAVAAEEARRSAEAAKTRAETTAMVAKEQASTATALLEALRLKVSREAKARAEAKEIAEALGGRDLERNPMFPKKKILRIRLAEEFDGRVSAEFRQRDDESGDKGVSLLMGRVYATRSVEPQCVLFDEALSDLECARWWQRHQGRKSFQPTKMGAAMQRTRALGEGGGGKAKGPSSKS